MKRLVLDWRGTPTLSVPADLYSVGATLEQRPVTGNPKGRILVGISPTILYTPTNDPSPRPYNMALYEAASRLNALIFGNTSFALRTVWQGENGYKTILFDLTKRGMLSAWLKLLDAYFPWADGFHIDYFSAWSWLFPDMAPSDQKWDDLLQTLGFELQKRGKLVLGQQFHLTSPLLGTNGAFVEQSPYAFRYTLDNHVADMNRWREFAHVRDDIWTYEIREWQNWPKSSLDLVKKWAEEQDVYVCLGRDGNVAP